MNVKVHIILMIFNEDSESEDQMVMRMKMMTGVAKCAMCMRVGGSLLSYEARKG